MKLIKSPSPSPKKVVKSKMSVQKGRVGHFVQITTHKESSQGKKEVGRRGVIVHCIL